MIAFLSALLIVASGITPVIRTSAGGACTPVYEETAWDNITGWSQSSENSFSADSVNDELDITAGSFDYHQWFRYDTTSAASNDMCVFAKRTSKDAGVSSVGALVRSPTSSDSTEFSYGLRVANDGTIIFFRAEPAATELASYSALHSNAGTTLDDGDYFSFCVSGTSTSTKFEYWDHGGTDPGPCRGDWGTVTIEETGCSSSCVDSDYRRSGLYYYSGSGSDFNAVYDEYALTDY